jgi:hypothetical protein
MAEDTAAVRQTIIEELEKGRSLLSICKDAGMPSREAVRLWQKADEAFDLAITRAREDGFYYLAEQARIKAQTAEDAAKGRLAFDADRWYLGKLSNAFSDNKAQKHEVTHDLSDKARAWLGLGS